MARLEFLDKIGIDRLSGREKTIGIIVILLITLSLAGYLYIPERKEIGKLNSDTRSLQMEVDTLNKQLAELKRRAEDLIQTEEGKNAAGEISRKIGDMLPGGDRLSVLLEEITRLARRRKVDFISIRPEGIEDKGSYLELAMKIAIKARYKEFGEYLSMLENLPRTIKVKDIKVESNAGISPYVIGQLEVITYMGKK